MEILLTATYTLLFIFIISKMKFFEVDGISKKTIIFIFLLKILFGLALWAVYTYYYTNRATADIYKYFDDSKVIFDILKTNPKHFFQLLFGIGNSTPEFDIYYSNMNFWARKIDSSIYNDSHTIIRFNTIVRFFSFGYYNVHTVFFCFLSLIGLTAIYKSFVKFLPDKKRELMLVVFFLPSVLFWGSGVLKEGLIFFALGLLIYHTQKLFSLKSIAICLASTLLLILSKFYVWIAILPGLLFMLWIIKRGNKIWLLKFAIVIVLIFTIGLNIDKFTSIQNPLITLAQKQNNFNELASGKLTDSEKKEIAPANSAIQINKLEPTLKSVFTNAPQAFVNTLFRPYVWELKSPMMIFAVFENLIIICFLIFSLFFLMPFKNIQWAMFLFCISFVSLQFLIIGETTPILGAIARYRTIALPLFFIALLFLIDKDKLLKKLPFLRKILN